MVHPARRIVRIYPLLLALLLVFGASQPDCGLAEDRNGWPMAMLADSDLRDVVFLDDRQGWAVGDRGVIWHTADAGTDWHLQTTPVACPLYAVFFHDSQHGWAVGGWTRPFVHRTTGVILRTTNGGGEWTQVEGLTLPLITHVRFFNPSRGWATGHGSALYPSGVFQTVDGGRSWSTLPSKQGGRWVSASFSQAERGIALNAAGQIALLARGQCRPMALLPAGVRQLRDLTLDAHETGWVVGDGGFLMRTTDGGRTWRNAAQQLPGGIADQFDFAAVTTHGEHCWIAGSPGTTVLHTADGGTHWDVFRTGQRLPISAMTFVSPRRGWAVGALGTILTTQDGGATWQRQSGAGSRAAIVAIYDRPESVPWECFAHLAGAEGYRARVVVIGRPDQDVDTLGPMPLEQRLDEAAVAAAATGADTAWQFPVRDAQLRLPATTIVNSWVAHGGPVVLPAERDGGLEEYLVRVTRIWQPDVVLTSAPRSSSADDLAQLVWQSVQSAAAKAADQVTYSNQINIAALPPWHVKQIATALSGSRLPKGQSISTAQLILPLARSVGDLAASARGLVAPEYQPVPPMIGYEVKLGDQPPAGRQRLFDGAELAPGSDGRRPPMQAQGTNLAELQRLLQRRRNIEALLRLDRADQPSQASAAWLGQLADLANGFDASATGEILFQLALRLAATGRPQLAADVLWMFIRRDPTHLLSEAALVHLVRHESSVEIHWRHSHSIPQPIQPSGRRSPPMPRPAGSPPPDGPSRGDSPRETFQQAAHESMLENAPSTRLAALETLIRTTRPELFAEPEIRLALLSADRARGGDQEAHGAYQGLLASAPRGAWRDCVLGEMWLGDRRGPPPRPTLRCPRAAKRPTLDGVLEDAAWQAGPPAILDRGLGEDDDWPARIWLVHDGEFLCLAAQCRKVAGAKYPAASGPRVRDPDLAEHDRIDLLFDVNRDYSSYWRLSVDHRGSTGEACADDFSWDPTWYVASREDQQHWYVEAAIPMRELVSQPPGAGQAWSVGIRRLIPRVGLQSWTRSASHDASGADGLGYLIFD